MRPDGDLENLPRVLGTCGSEDGPLLIVFGGLHGNEPAGVRASRLVLQELVERARGERDGDGGPHLLFLGFRHEARDFLYADEWRAWEAAGAVRLFTAFSRDQAEKLYVQDRMRQQGALLWERMESGNHFYVCGDATRMAGDVERAMLEIIEAHGGRAPAEAQAYLAELESAGRLQKDVWPTGP